MKRILISMLIVLGFSGALLATDPTPGTYFSLGNNLDFTVPGFHVDAMPYLYSFTANIHVAGAETRLATWPRVALPVEKLRLTIPPNSLNLNVGAVTSFQSNGMPYLSLSVNIGKIVQTDMTMLSYLSAGFGHDFKTNANHFLVGTAIPLYDIKAVFVK